MTLARKSPIARKRPTARKWKSPRCDVRGCHKKAEVFWGRATQVTASFTTSSATYVNVPDSHIAHAPPGYCHSHARIEALRRWSYSVRTGMCELGDFHARYNVRCAGPNVAGHGFGKGAYPSVMFERWNGFSKCSGLNAWVEDHVLEWDGYLREVWGDQYESRRQMALSVRKYDLGDVIASLPPVPKKEKENRSD